MDISLIEYKVRPITRYVVTRFEASADSTSLGSSTLGEYDNSDVAYQVGYALCRAEHERLKLPLGDERIRYPENPNLNRATTASEILSSQIGGETEDRFPLKNHPSLRTKT